MPTPEFNSTTGFEWVQLLNADNSVGNSPTSANHIFLGKGLSIGGGTAIKQYLSATNAWNPGTNIANGAITNTTVTVTGASPGDPAYAGLTTLTNAGGTPLNVILSAKVSATNTVTVTLRNRTGSALSITNGTVRVGVWKY